MGLREFSAWAQCIDKADVPGAQKVIDELAERSDETAKELHAYLSLQQRHVVDIENLLKGGLIKEARTRIKITAFRIRRSLKALADIYELHAPRKEHDTAPAAPTAEDSPMILFFTDLQKNLPKNGEAGSAS